MNRIASSTARHRLTPANAFGGMKDMGYDLHITRAKWHYMNEGAWIAADEWLAYVERDPELRLAGFNGEYFTLWSGGRKDPEPWFDWFDGNVYTKNPSEPVIDKMIAIAKALGGKVQGDEGEIYLGPGKTNVQPPPAD
jgi:hypothetical protein